MMNIEIARITNDKELYWNNPIMSKKLGLTNYIEQLEKPDYPFNNGDIVEIVKGTKGISGTLVGIQNFKGEQSIIALEGLDFDVKTLDYYSQSIGHIKKVSEATPVFVSEYTAIKLGVNEHEVFKALEPVRILDVFELDNGDFVALVQKMNLEKGLINLKNISFNEEVDNVYVVKSDYLEHANKLVELNEMNYFEEDSFIYKFFDNLNLIENWCKKLSTETIITLTDLDNKIHYLSVSNSGKITFNKNVFNGFKIATTLADIITFNIKCEKVKFFDYYFSLEEILKLKEEFD